MCRSRADAEKALAQMSGAVLGSRRIRCGWAQHKQETSSASYAAVDRVSAAVYASAYYHGAFSSSYYMMPCCLVLSRVRRYRP